LRRCRISDPDSPHLTPRLLRRKIYESRNPWQKIGMTQVFRPDGQVVPVTLLKAGPCMVVQRKTPTTDGYDAVQLGLMEFVKPARINKPQTGHLKKAGAEGAKFLREFHLRPATTISSRRQGAGGSVQAQGKGGRDRRQQGPRFRGRGEAPSFPRRAEGSHGSMFHRAPGSIGASSFPSRVFPGMRMGGHMGRSR
jgi:large subunit ribosomal protein L3